MTAVLDRDARRLRLVGELDLSTGPLLLDAADGLRTGAGLVTVDLTELTFLDVAGLSTLLAFQERVTRQGDAVVLVGAGTQARRLFELAGLEALLPTADAGNLPDGEDGARGRAAGGHGAGGPEPHRLPGTSAPLALEVSPRQPDGTVYLRATGRWDTHRAGEVEASMRKALACDPSLVILDLAEVEATSAAGRRVLAAAVQYAAAHARLEVQNVPPDLHHLGKSLGALQSGQDQIPPQIAGEVDQRRRLRSARTGQRTAGESVPARTRVDARRVPRSAGQAG